MWGGGRRMGGEYPLVCRERGGVCVSGGKGGGRMGGAVRYVHLLKHLALLLWHCQGGSHSCVFVYKDLSLHAMSHYILDSLANCQFTDDNDCIYKFYINTGLRVVVATTPSKTTPKNTFFGVISYIHLHMHKHLHTHIYMHTHTHTHTLHIRTLQITGCNVLPPWFLAAVIAGPLVGLAILGLIILAIVAIIMHILVRGHSQNE